MPEESVEYLDDNENNEKSSSNSSPKNNTNNIIDINEYKSRKNSSKSSDSKNDSLNLRNRVGNTIKRGITNKAMNKASQALPAIGAINTANNIRKMAVARKKGVAATNNTEVNGETENTEDNATVNTTDNVVEDNNSEKPTFNPLASIFGSKNSFMSRFTFWGKLSLPLKVAIIAGPALFAILLLLIILAIPLGAHSSLLSLDTGIKSNSTGTIDYGDYVLSSDGHQILHEPLSSFLESKGTSLEEFNNLIASNVEDAGYGTRAGVVSAAVTLIAELGNNYGVKIPYFWGGGHGVIANGADGSWGSSACHTYANGNSYNYCGLDCSGFVPWAIYNGGFNISPLTTGGFQSLPGAQRVTLTDSAILQPGDLLESSGHIVLIVGIEGNQYVCAEASGNTTGVLFTRRSFDEPRYWGVNMDGFYSSQVRS